MKRYIIFNSLFLILLSFNLKSESKNLIENGGFEKYKEGEKVPDGWVINTAYPCKVTIMEDEEIAKEGKVFLRIDEDKEKTKGASGAVYYKGINIKKDTEYKFSVWAKGKGKIILFLYEYNDTGFLGSVNSGDMELTSEWKEYVLEYKPGITKHSKPDVMRVSPAIHIKDSAYVDNAIFIEIKKDN